MKNIRSDETPSILGGGLGGLNRPSGLAIDNNGKVFVADTGNHRIAVWDLWLASWTFFGTFGAGMKELNNPTAVAVDDQGRLLVTDSGNYRIIRINDLDGSGWIAFGREGRPHPSDDAIGCFADPRSVITDARGRIVVADPGAGRVIRINDLDGSGWTEVILPVGSMQTRPFSVAQVGDNLAVIDINNRSMHLLDDTDQVIVTLSAGTDDILSPIMVAANGPELLMADLQRNELFAYSFDNRTLRFQKKIRGSGPEIVNSLFENIGGIAIGG